MIRIIAGKYGWVTFDKSLWYKGKMNLALGQFEPGEIVFVRENSDMPARGRTFWILGAQRKLMHVGEEVAWDYVGLKLQNGRAVPSTIDETKSLNSRFAPLLDEVKHEHERTRRVTDRLQNNKEFIGRRPKALKKKQDGPNGQGNLF